MSDLINRKDAIDAINKYGSVWIEYTEGMSIDEIAERALQASKQSMVEILRELPSAQKKGKWLLLDGYRCSECNHKLQTTGLPSSCPNCGADMRGERNE